MKSIQFFHKYNRVQRTCSNWTRNLSIGRLYTTQRLPKTVACNLPTITLVEIFVIISYLRTFREITELFIRKLPDTYTSSLACCMFEIFVIISYFRSLH
jgi:hypothetical protein